LHEDNVELFEKLCHSEEKRFRSKKHLEDCKRIYNELCLLRHKSDRLNQVKNVIGKIMKEFFKNKKSSNTNGNSNSGEEDLNKMIETMCVTNDHPVLKALSHSEIEENLTKLPIDDLKKIKKLADDNYTKNITSEIKELEAKFENMWNHVGNFVHPDVVKSKNEMENKLIKTWGDVEQRKKYSHIDLCSMIDGFDPVRGTKVSGSRGYFLKGPLVFLAHAIQMYGLHFLIKKGYTAVQTPYFMNKTAMKGVAQQSQFDDELYKVHGKWMNTNPDKDEDAAEEKYLIATSEQPLAAMYSNETIDVEQEPIKIAGYSTCFRQEAGSHGRDTRGIFRVHQYEKIEQFIYCNPDQSEKIFHQLQDICCEFYESLNIPYRIVSIVSGEINNAASIKHDIEGFFPSGGEFRELVSCSNCTDYQARAAKTKMGKKGAAKTPFCHMLNSTLCAITRTICIILELYQDHDLKGIKVPEVLKKFMPEEYENLIPFVDNEVTAK